MQRDYRHWELTSVLGDELRLASYGLSDEELDSMLWHPRKREPFNDEEFFFTAYFSPHERAEDEDAGFSLHHHRYRYAREASLDGAYEHTTESWLTAGLLRRSDRGWSIVRLSIEPVNRGERAGECQSITGGVLRGVRLGVLHSALAALADDLPERTEYLTYDEWLQMGSPTIKQQLDTLPAPGKRPSRGRPRRGQEELRQFALDFLECKGNYRAMSKKTGKPVETVRSWLKAARKAGWIAPGMAGVKGAPIPGRLLLEERKRS